MTIIILKIILLLAYFYMTLYWQGKIKISLPICPVNVIQLKFSDDYHN